jgi:hypothetical protein
MMNEGVNEMSSFVFSLMMTLPMMFLSALACHYANHRWQVEIQGWHIAGLGLFLIMLLDFTGFPGWILNSIQG